MTKKTGSDFEFTLNWKSSAAQHADVFYASKLDISHDLLPSDFAENIQNLEIGESYTKTLQAIELLGESYTSEKVIPFDASLFDINFKNQYSPAILHRFYPTAIAWQGLNASDTDYTPFRLITVDGNNLVADQNHPLAKYYLNVTATKINQSKPTDTQERPKRDIARLLTSKGPGMQAPFEFGDSVFFKQYPFELAEKTPLNHHQLHPKSSDAISILFKELLSKHSKLLDVLSNQKTYLPADYETGLLAGIGIPNSSHSAVTKEEELAANERLDTYQVQDLNSDSHLPYEANSFDDAICSLSIEALNDPISLFKEIARVVVTGGKFIVTFSNVTSAETPITLWAQLHPFEKIQLVLEYFRESAEFTELNTFSKRGIANPVYAVWGTVT